MLMMFFRTFHVLSKSINSDYPHGVVSFKHCPNFFEVYMDSFNNFKDKLLFIVPFNLSSHEKLCEIPIITIVKEGEHDIEKHEGSSKAIVFDNFFQE